ncbi:MAG: hypothetical protein CEE43_15880 [Promethearchaeota archaeon Loki_b32]|nr:MAG: hypothetical protein CEE43_15880 [Candidatus Lokiarchaeota archaeon Loki_b32]
MNNPYFRDEYYPLEQYSKDDLEKGYNERPDESTSFFIEKKDGTKIGNITYSIGKSLGSNLLEIGFTLIPSERKKGYCTEVVKLFVVFLFLSKDIVRIQARTDTRNIASQRVLEKTGFKKEGVLRKIIFMRGEWRDLSLFNILREEWKEPKILKF